jgi:membrane protease YdiL (CAAX protease family)
VNVIVGTTPPMGSGAWITSSPQLVRVNFECYFSNELDLPQTPQPSFDPSPFPALPLPPLKPAVIGYELLPLGGDQRAVWPVFAVFLSAIAASIGASMLAIAAFVAASRGQVVNNEQLTGGISQMMADPIGRLALLASGQLAFLVVSLASAAMSPMGIKHRLQAGKSRLPIWGYLILPAGMFAIGMLSDAAVKILHIEVGGTLQMLDKTFSELSGSQLALSLFIAAVAPGVAEELLFRGYIQSRLTARWGAIVSILISALLFGLAHFDKLQSPMTFVMGLYLGLIAYRSGSIRPTMWCHAINNGGAVLLAWGSAQTAGTDAGDTSHVGMQIGVGAGVLALCVVLLLLTTRARRDAGVALT